MALINPSELIKTLTVEELCETAEDYFKNIPNPPSLINKPFNNIHESPEILYNFGMVMTGLRLGKSMTVLDFGAGTCWISHLLNQMGCSTISCDVSKSALEIGKKLFHEKPISGGHKEPQFIVFDGYKIDLPDNSVDRIICSDAFHHIPNQEYVLKELYRVLKTGGIAGFSEPGRYHSQNPQSQTEMKNYRVLENDIILEDIKAICDQIGFSNMEIKLVSNPYQNVGYEDYLSIVKGNIPAYVGGTIKSAMIDKTIFFLYKGEFVYDSRSHLGLMHKIESEINEISSKSREVIKIPLKVKNNGQAKWLANNINGIGVVKLGAHLYKDGKLIDFDFYRENIPHDLNPDESWEWEANITLISEGDYTLSFDLVSEGICWFENVGAKAKDIRITIES